MNYNTLGFVSTRTKQKETLLDLILDFILLPKPLSFCLGTFSTWSLTKLTVGNNPHVDNCLLFQGGVSLVGGSLSRTYPYLVSTFECHPSFQSVNILWNIHYKSLCATDSQYVFKELRILLNSLSQL